MTTTDNVRDLQSGPVPESKPEPELGRRPGVHSWDEFTRLREVVVGDASGTVVSDRSDPSTWLNSYPKLTAAELAGIEMGAVPQHIIEEANEDLAELASALRGLGITVHRPAVPDHDAEFGSPAWRSRGRSAYCPRDLTLVIGSTIIEAPSPMRARYFEVFGLRDLFQEYLLAGAHWIAAPRPRLLDELFLTGADGLPELGETEPVFDAANVLRLGRDVFYQVSRSGNEFGLRWLQDTLGLLGDLRVHPLRNVYKNTHIDSTITLLRPGLALLNPARIQPDAVPEPLRNWDVLWCPPLRPQVAPNQLTLSEAWIGMNLLMIDPEHAVVDADQPDLIKALEGKGIAVLPLRMRHAQVLGGGFHCVTLDTVRDGGAENYLD